MDQILSKQHYRRTFFSIVALVLLLALIARFFVIPYFEPAQKLSGAQLLGSLLDNLVVSLFLAVFLGVFVFWLTPDIVKRSVIEVVEPNQINPALKAVTSSTKSWIYKGSCGRYTRATTLPKLAEAARVDGFERDITICILNPKNDALCSAYATYRRSLKSASSSTWTRQIVQEEVIATAITALKFQYSEPLLRIRLFFVDHFSAFRLDISDQFVMVTKEDKYASALRADAGTYFYNSYKDDVRLTERQSDEMKRCSELEFAKILEENQLREVLRFSGIFDEVRLAELDVPRLLKCINSPSDPY